MVTTADDFGISEVSTCIVCGPEWYTNGSGMPLVVRLGLQWQRRHIPQNGQ